MQPGCRLRVQARQCSSSVLITCLQGCACTEQRGVPAGRRPMCRPHTSRCKPQRLTTGTVGAAGAAGTADTARGHPVCHTCRSVTIRRPWERAWVQCVKAWHSSAGSPAFIQPALLLKRSQGSRRRGSRRYSSCAAGQPRTGRPRCPLNPDYWRTLIHDASRSGACTPCCRKR